MTNLDRYLKHAEGVTGYRRSLARVNRLTGNASTLLGSQALASHVSGAGAPSIEWGIPTAAGAAAGAIIGARHGHWLLGAISGASVFTNAPAVLKPGTRNEALWNLAQTHGAVFASLAMRENKAFGFALGYLAVGIARYLYGDGGLR